MILSIGSWSASMWVVLPLAVLALCAYAVAAWPGLRPLQDQALRLACAAHGLVVVIHLLGLGSGAPPRLGFAPVLSATAWLVLTVYVVESHFVPLRGMRRLLALLGLLTLPVLLLFPGQGASMQAAPLWEPLHVILAIASYALFGAAVLHAVVLNRSERAMRRTPLAGPPVMAGAAGGGLPAPALPLLTLEKLTFRFVDVGFAVLSAALLIGWWFASPWRWDHKTVFSLLGWAVFAGLLLGRRTFGWRGRRATRWLYAGAILLLLAYVGSRFVLEVLLHRAPPSVAAGVPAGSGGP